MFFLLIESHGKSLLDSRYVHCAFIAKSDHWVWRTMIEGGCVATVPAAIRHPPPPVAVPSANLVPRSPEIANIIANPCSSAQFCTFWVWVWRCKYIHGYSFDVCKVLSWRIGEILNVFLAHIFLQNNDNIKSAIVWNDISSVRPLGSNDT